MKLDKGVLYKTKPNYNFEKVDIFLRVKGYLPSGEKDKLTQEILNEYCKKYKNNKLTEGMANSFFLYFLIKTEEITAI